MEMIRAFIDKTARGRGIIFANQKNQVDDRPSFQSAKINQPEVLPVAQHPLR